MANLVASGNYTYVQFQPGETSSVWHTDQEFTDSGGSYLFRTYNAEYDPGGPFWKTITPGVSEAYATVQNPDGSIHYYSNYNQTTSTFEPTWTHWFGSGNNAAFNGVDFGMDPGAADNTAALNAVITAAMDAGGGEVRLPPGTYSISDIIDLSFAGIPGNDSGIIVRGVSGKTEILQTTITADVFSVSGYGSGRGIRFEDLRITYATTDEAQTTLAAAVRVINSQNVTCERVYFNNCPQAFYTDSLESGLFDCTITYDNFGLGTSATVVPVMVYLGGTENYIDSCVISQRPRGVTENPGPVGCIGVVVDPGGGAYFITNTHISDFTQGIVVNGSSQNLVRVFCSNVICESWSNSLVMQPTGSSTIQQVYCSDCLFARSGASTDTMSIGVVIGASGGSNGSVGEIFLNNCMCIQWNVAGVQVNAGQAIVITGGRYGSNAFNPSSTSGGITLAGGADVTISGADLTPKITNPVFPTQTYAIAIIAAVGGLYVRGCSMTGYASPGPLYLSSPGTNIQITDCAGYNDVYGLLASSAPTSAHVFTAAADYGYYGPVTFYVGNGTGLSLHIETHLIPIPTGAFTLGPGESAQLNYTSGGGPPPIAPPPFTMIGN